MFQRRKAGRPLGAREPGDGVVRGRSKDEGWEGGKEGGREGGKVGEKRTLCEEV